MHRTVVLIGLLTLPAAYAAEEPIKLKTDLRSQYFVVERGGTATKPTLVVKRIGPSGTSYTKRAFDCEARTAKHVGTGDSLEEMAKAKPDPDMSPLVDGSVTQQLWQQVCGK